MPSHTPNEAVPDVQLFAVPAKSTVAVPLNDAPNESSRPTQPMNVLCTVIVPLNTREFDEKNPQRPAVQLVNLALAEATMLSAVTNAKHSLPPMQLVY